MRVCFILSHGSADKVLGSNDTQAILEQALARTAVRRTPKQQPGSRELFSAKRLTTSVNEVVVGFIYYKGTEKQTEMWRNVIVCGF